MKKITKLKEKDWGNIKKKPNKKLTNNIKSESERREGKVKCEARKLQRRIRHLQETKIEKEIIIRNKQKN